MRRRLRSLGLSGLPPPPVYGLGFGRGEEDEERDDGDDDSRPPLLDRLRTVEGN